jgi:hypothetical protein
VGRALHARAPALLAISRCFSADIDANPRRSLRSVVTAWPVSLPTLRSNDVRTLLPGCCGDPHSDAARQTASPVLRQTLVVAVRSGRTRLNPSAGRPRSVHPNTELLSKSVPIAGTGPGS